MRLAKYLAHAGVASRRAAEQLIADGRVTVDGEVVTDPARDVDERRARRGRRRAGRRRPSRARSTRSTSRPASSRRRATRTAADGRRPRAHARRRLYPVGRLDADTTGLILLTNDGELANRLTHPRYEVPKTYRARVARPPVRERRAAARCARASSSRTAGPRPRRCAGSRPACSRSTIREGRKRQVRRMCEAVGHPVIELERVAFGPLRLGRPARPGRGDAAASTAAARGRQRGCASAADALH